MSMDNHEQSIVAIPPNSGRRRSFTGLFKRELVEQTLRPDVSVAGVALANGLNKASTSFLTPLLFASSPEMLTDRSKVGISPGICRAYKMVAGLFALDALPAELVERTKNIPNIRIITNLICTPVFLLESVK